MIVDVTGIELIPGNSGKDCKGNGEHEGIECCCDECDYFLCCFGEGFPGDAGGRDVRGGAEIVSVNTI